MGITFVTIFSILISLTHSIGVTLGVGASTFAIVLFLRALQDGTIDSSERYLLGAVYTVLRVGMALIALPLFIIGGIWAYQGATQLLFSSIYIIEWFILAIILVNAVLMTKKKMPMWLGPAVAGGSWYALFLLLELPLGGFAFPILLVYYVAFVLLFFAVFTMLRKRYAPQLHTAKPATSTISEKPEHTDTTSSGTDESNDDTKE